MKKSGRLRTVITNTLLVVGIALLAYALVDNFLPVLFPVQPADELLNIDLSKLEDDYANLDMPGIILPVDKEDQKLTQDAEGNIVSVAELAAAQARKEYQNGQMRIRIPRLELDWMVIGTDDSAALKLGPCLFEKSPLPTMPGGNVCIAAHREVYGAWFLHMDDMRMGDKIYLIYDGQVFIYQVVLEPYITDPHDWSITDKIPEYNAVTLMTCHPIGTSKSRMIVRGQLIKVIPIEESPEDMANQAQQDAEEAGRYTEPVTGDFSPGLEDPGELDSNLPETVVPAPETQPQTAPATEAPPATEEPPATEQPPLPTEEPPATEPDPSEPPITDIPILPGGLGGL